MWIYLTLVSAVLLGAYDVCKKKALRRNSVLWVLFSTSALSTLLLLPFFSLDGGLPFGTGGGVPGGQDIAADGSQFASNLLRLVPKAFLVTASWISGLIGIKLLPLTTASTLKASRPVFVIIFSMLIFGERLSPLQWVGVTLALSALLLLSRSSRKEGIIFHKNKGILWMCISIASGVASALYDKFIISGLHLPPFFVQCWSTLFITVLMGTALGLRALVQRRRVEPLRWDWYLLLAAALIVGADAAYFFALTQEGALLSVISLLRRGSVIVTFILSALIFKESNLRDKAAELALLLGGVTILALC